jgi:ArsR family transcriptional regulator
MELSGSRMDAETLQAAKHQEEICRVFGNVNRVMIVWALDDQEMSVGDIAAAIDSSLQNTSQHLRLMKDKGVLTSRRKGHTIYYRVADHELAEGCRAFQSAPHQAVPASPDSVTKNSSGA